jgi:aldehyde dehydrogenase (NAD+)
VQEVSRVRSLETKLIRLGTEEGATMLVSGEGRPEGLKEGYFVKPTVFTNVRNDMTIARETVP